MDVFGVAVAAGGDLLRDAAIACGHELGVFAGGTLTEIADRAGLGKGRRRLRPLVDVLVALGTLEWDGDRVRVVGAPPKPVVPRAGWGLAAQVMRTNRALDVEGGDVELRYHQHLLRAGAAPARELWETIGGVREMTLVDLGGGAGAYTRAFFEAGGERATLVDFHEVLVLARGALGEAGFADRTRFVSGDASCAPAIGDGYDIALLANVLHLHGPATCVRLVAAAARYVRPGGRVVIKELRVDDDRRGPLEGLLFALNMAIFTGEGDVYVTGQLRAWLEQAGLVDLHAVELAAATNGVCLVAGRPQEPAT